MAAPAFQSQLVLDPVRVADLLRGRSGAVLRRLLVDGALVKARAREQVGVHQPLPGERRKRRPGTLRDSIVVRIVEGGKYATVAVGSEDPIAFLHHEGTPPHVIRARIKPMLVFYWPKVGQVVAFKQVNHPGTKPNRYLTDSLKVLNGRYR